MTPQQQQQQQPLQSYQRATTNPHVQNDDPACNNINRQPPPPPPPLPRKLRCTTMISVSHNSLVVHRWKMVATALGMIVLLVVFVATVIMTSTSSNIQKIRPMLEMSHVVSIIFQKVSSGTIIGGDDIDDHSITKRIVPNEHQRQQQYHVLPISTETTTNPLSIYGSSSCSYPLYHYPTEYKMSSAFDPYSYTNHCNHYHNTNLIGIGTE